MHLKQRVTVCPKTNVKMIRNEGHVTWGGEVENWGQIYSEKSIDSRLERIQFNSSWHGVLRHTLPHCIGLTVKTFKYMKIQIHEMT